MTISKSREPIQFVNRYTGLVETEAVYGEAYLRWAYETRLGAFSRWALLKRPLFSKWYGWRMNQAKSRKRVAPFIEKYGLDPAEWAAAPESYESFNSFFIRALKPEARPIVPSDEVIVFPADGRHLAFPDASKISQVFVKGQRFDIKALINDAALAKNYEAGSLLLSRLCPVDYHRFHFPAAGIPSPARMIEGPLSSVNPIALRKHLSIFWENKRALTILDTPNLGRILCFEIGATCVGSITQSYTPNARVEKGAEKGYFRFGGSSTLLIFEPGRITFDEDLLQASAKGLELYAKMGDQAGRGV